jgi:hypothetical protein
MFLFHTLQALSNIACSYSLKLRCMAGSWRGGAGGDAQVTAQVLLSAVVAGLQQAAAYGGDDAGTIDFGAMQLAGPGGAASGLPREDPQ